MTAFSAAMLLIRVRTSFFWFGSRPSVGSSRMRAGGLVNEGLGETDALLVAFGERFDRLRADRGEMGEVEHVFDAGALFDDIAEAADLGDERQEFGDGHLG